MRYAQLDNQGFVVNILESDTELDSAQNLIAIDHRDDLEYALVGSRYVHDMDRFELMFRVMAYNYRVTKLAFRNRFTMEEKTNIYAAAESDIQIRIFLDDVNAAEYIQLDSTEIQHALAYLAEVGLVDQSRVPAILAGTRTMPQ